MSVTLVPLKHGGTVLREGEFDEWGDGGEPNGAVVATLVYLDWKGGVQPPRCSQEKALEPFSLLSTPSSPSQVLSVLIPKPPLVFPLSYLHPCSFRCSPKRGLLSVKGTLNSFQTTLRCSLLSASLPGPTCL